MTGAAVDGSSNLEASGIVGIRAREASVAAHHEAVVEKTSRTADRTRRGMLDLVADFAPCAHGRLADHRKP